MTNLLNIFEYEELIDWGIDCAIIRNVTLLKDFGPLEKDSQHFDIFFDFDKFECRVADEDGETTHDFKITLSAM